MTRNDDDVLAVRAESRARHGDGNPAAFERNHRREFPDLLTALSVPQPRSVVRGRGDDALAVRTERCAIYGMRVARGLFARLRATRGHWRTVEPVPFRLIECRIECIFA